MNFKNKRLPGKMALWLAACALIIAADIPAQAETSKTSLKGPGVEQTQETGTSDKNADTATADITQAIVVDENTLITVSADALPRCLTSISSSAHITPNASIAGN